MCWDYNPVKTPGFATGMARKLTEKEKSTREGDCRGKGRENFLRYFVSHMSSPSFVILGVSPVIKATGPQGRD